MKTTAFFLTCLVLTFSVVSCNNDDDNNNDSSNAVQQQIQANVKNGVWRISKFIDSGTDETNHFSSYRFTFGDAEILTASNDTNTYTGTWSITDSNSNDDNDSQDDLDFNINFNLTNEFQDLNDDWDFVSQSASKIELIDVSGGNGGTDYLSFEKN